MPAPMGAATHVARWMRPRSNASRSGGVTPLRRRIRAATRPGMVAAAAHAAIVVHALPRSGEGTSWIAHAATPSIPREPAMRIAPPSRLRDRRFRSGSNGSSIATMGA